MNSACRDCPDLGPTKYKRRVCACAAIRGESDKILNGHHAVAVSVVLPVAKAVNVCQLGENGNYTKDCCLGVCRSDSRYGHRNKIVFKLKVISLPDVCL